MTSDVQAEKLIEIALENLSGLFHGLDPAPLPKRKLGPDMADYIVQCAGEHDGDGPIRIRFHMPAKEALQVDAAAVAAAVNGHFRNMACHERRGTGALFQTGRQVLAIGVTVFVICVLALWMLEKVSSGVVYLGLVQESIVILGWVIVWKPTEIFLYEWLPIRKQRKLYERLAAASVSILPRPD